MSKEKGKHHCTRSFEKNGAVTNPAKERELLFWREGRVGSSRNELKKEFRVFRGRKGGRKAPLFSTEEG